MYRTTFLLVFTGIIYSGLYAQQDTMVYRIDDIVVKENRIQLSASKKPGSVLIIGKESIRRSSAASIPDILNFQPGIDIRSRGANGIQSDPGIRGSTFDQVLILVDGIRMNDPQTGHHSLNLPVDLSAVDHIEVYKGPSARVFGQDAYAGAINIITSVPDSNITSVSATAGDFGLVGSKLSGAFGSSMNRSYISAGIDRSSGYRYNTDYLLSNIFFRSDYRGRAGEIGITGGFSLRNFGANGFYASPENTDQYEELRTGFSAISFTPRTETSAVNIRCRVYWRGNKDEYIFIRSDPDYYRNIHFNNTLGADVNATVHTSAGITGIGLDAHAAGINSSRLGNHSRTGLSLFIEQNIMLFDEKLTVSPGIQLNHYSDFKNSILPGLDMSLGILPHLMLFISTGYTYRVPSFTDLYYEDPVNSANPGLQPEYAFSGEIGFKTVKKEGYHLCFSLFQRKGYDVIDRVKEDTDDKWIPLNVERIINNGLDMDVSLYLSELFDFSLRPLNSFSFGYTFINSENKGTEYAYSRYVFENLRHQFVSTVRLNYTGRLSQTISFRYFDRYGMDNYSLVDTGIYLRYRNWNFSLGISNILSTEYAGANLVVMPGRWFSIGISTSIQTKG